MNANKNDGSILSPSWDEMRMRYETAASSFLRLARRYGGTPDGEFFLKKAQASTGLASQARIESACGLLLRDGFPEVAAKLRSGALSLDDVRKFRIAAEEAARRV